MDKTNVFYFDGEAAASEVRFLIFNDSINLYDAESNDFIKAFPLKGTSVDKRGESVLIQLSPKEGLHVSANSDLVASLIKNVSYANQSFVKKFVRHKVLWFGAIVLAILIGLYFLIMTLVPYIGTAIISRDAEVKMGKQLKEVMIAEERIAGAVVDSTGTARLQQFADKINLSDSYPIHVTLVRSNTINAYALPGGQIVVYSGMLDNITSSDELAALLAHEASHVNRRHSLRAMLRSGADALVLSILFSDISAITATIIGNTRSLRALDYSRSAEREADEYGMQLMLKNNINVSGMKKLMQILQKQGDVPGNVSFLSSHPLTRKRIEAAEDFIRNHPQQEAVDDELQLLFERIKQ